MILSREGAARFLDRSGALGLFCRARRLLPKSRFPAFTYHRVVRVLPDQRFCDSVVDATSVTLREHFRSFSEWTTSQSLADVELLHSRWNRDKPPVLITFDDGYRSCHDIVLPLLQEFGLRATFFITTRMIEERRLFWWDQVCYLIRSSTRDRFTVEYPHQETIRPAEGAGAANRLLAAFEHTPHLDHERAVTELAQASGVEWNRAIERDLADELLMTWDQVRTLERAGMDIGSHLQTHRRMHFLEPSELEAELVGSKRDLEARLDRPIRAVAYPHGYPLLGREDLRRAVVDAGYTLGCTFGGGLNAVPCPDRLGIKRIPVNREHSLAFFRMQVALPQTAFVSPRMREPG